MSAGAWGDEGNVPDNAKDTAIYQELVSLRAKFTKWQDDSKNEFRNDEEIAKAVLISDTMDELIEILGE